MKIGIEIGKCKSSCCEDCYYRQSFILWLKVLFSVALRTVPVQLSPSPDAGGGEREGRRERRRRKGEGREKRGERRGEREERKEERRGEGEGGTEGKEGRREQKYHNETVNYNSILCKLFCTSCKLCAYKF